MASNFKVKLVLEAVRSAIKKGRLNENSAITCLSIIYGIDAPMLRTNEGESVEVFEGSDDLLASRKIDDENFEQIIEEELEIIQNKIIGLDKPLSISTEVIEKTDKVLRETFIQLCTDLSELNNSKNYLLRLKMENIDTSKVINFLENDTLKTLYDIDEEYKNTLKLIYKNAITINSMKDVCQDMKKKLVEINTKCTVTKEDLEPYEKLNQKELSEMVEQHRLVESKIKEKIHLLNEIKFNKSSKNASLNDSSNHYS